MLFKWYKISVCYIQCGVQVTNISAIIYITGNMFFPLCQYCRLNCMSLMTHMAHNNHRCYHVTLEQTTCWQGFRTLTLPASHYIFLKILKFMVLPEALATQTMYLTCRSCIVTTALASRCF